MFLYQVFKLFHNLQHEKQPRFLNYLDGINIYYQHSRNNQSEKNHTIGLQIGINNVIFHNLKINQEYNQELNKCYNHLITFHQKLIYTKLKKKLYSFILKIYNHMLREYQKAHHIYPNHHVIQNIQLSLLKYEKEYMNCKNLLIYYNNEIGIYGVIKLFVFSLDDITKYMDWNNFFWFKKINYLEIFFPKTNFSIGYNIKQKAIELNVAITKQDGRMFFENLEYFILKNKIHAYETQINNLSIIEKITKEILVTKANIIKQMQKLENNFDKFQTLFENYEEFFQIILKWIEIINDMMDKNVQIINNIGFLYLKKVKIQTVPIDIQNLFKYLSDK